MTIAGYHCKTVVLQINSKWLNLLTSFENVKIQEKKTMLVIWLKAIKQSLKLLNKTNIVALHFFSFLIDNLVQCRLGNLKVNK